MMSEIDTEYLHSLYQELSGETGEKIIGKQTLLQLVHLALRYKEIVCHQHLWGIVFDDNNKVDAHNVFETRAAATLKSWEMSMRNEIVPLYYERYCPKPSTGADNE